MSNYRPSRGGHAPGHLRELLTLAVEGDQSPWWQNCDDPEMADSLYGRTLALWQAKDTKERARWLTGQLWNCTDYLSGGWVYGESRGWTYGTLARCLRGEIES